MVADLRGDGDNAKLVRRMQEGATSVEDVLSLGHRIDRETVERLPDFNMINGYLRNITRGHIIDIAEITNDIEKSYKITEDAHKDRHDKLQSETQLSKEILAEMIRKVERNKQNIIELENNLKKEGVSKSIELPEKFLYPPLEAVPYCLKIPSMALAGYDAKKKKKKPIPVPDLREILDLILEGKYDQVEWDFGVYYPSSSQLNMLNKATKARKEALNIVREAELRERNEADDVSHKAQLSFQFVNSLIVMIFFKSQTA